MPDGMIKRLLELKDEMSAKDATIDTQRLVIERLESTILSLQTEVKERDDTIAKMVVAREHRNALLAQMEEALTTMDIELRTARIESLLSALPAFKNQV